MRKTRHELFLERAAALRVKVHELHAIGMKTSHIARQLDITAPRVHQILWPGGKKPKGNGEQAPAQANGGKPEPNAKPPVLVDMRKMASKGGRARAAKLSADKISEISSKAGKASAEAKRAKAAEKKRAKAEAAQ
jgi:hypothetical protein